MMSATLCWCSLRPSHYFLFLSLCSRPRGRQGCDNYRGMVLHGGLQRQAVGHGGSCHLAKRPAGYKTLIAKHCRAPPCALEPCGKKRDTPGASAPQAAREAKGTRTFSNGANAHVLKRARRQKREAQVRPPPPLFVWPLRPPEIVYTSQHPAGIRRTKGPPESRSIPTRLGTARQRHVVLVTTKATALTHRPAATASYASPASWGPAAARARSCDAGAPTRPPQPPPPPPPALLPQPQQWLCPPAGCPGWRRPAAAAPGA